MRIRTLALLTSFAAFGCPSDDDDGTTDQTTTGPTTTSPTTTDGSESSTSPTTTSPTTTDGSESSTSPTTTGTESGSESESGTSPDTGSSGSESGGPSVTCEAYCTAYEATCTDPEVSTQYDDHQDCLDTCAGFDPGMPGDTMGDTAECRLYHVGAAAGDPGTHCPHAQEVPEGGCV